MGRISFGCLGVWALSPEWLSHKPEVCDFCQVLRWNRRAWGRGMRAVPRLCILYPGICLKTEEKSRKNLGQGTRKALGWSAPNAIRLVDLAIAGDGLNWPAGPCRPWLSRQATDSTLGRRNYMPRGPGTPPFSRACCQQHWAPQLHQSQPLQFTVDVRSVSATHPSGTSSLSADRMPLHYTAALIYAEAITAGENPVADKTKHGILATALGVCTT